MFDIKIGMKLLFLYLSKLSNDKTMLDWINIYVPTAKRLDTKIMTFLNGYREHQKAEGTDQCLKSLNTLFNDNNKKPWIDRDDDME